MTKEQELIQQALRERIDPIIGEVISVTELSVLHESSITTRLNTLNHLRIVSIDQILSLIKEACYFKAERELPQYDFTNTPVYFESGYNIAQQDMLTTDSKGRVWAPVYKEW